MKTKRVPLNANNLTQAIINYINNRGGHAFRVNNQGQFQEYNAKSSGISQASRMFLYEISNSLKMLGFTVGRWRKAGAGEKGISDIVGCCNGKFFGIEVKIGKDRMSPHQKDFQKHIESSGGVYFVAKDYKGFLEKWEELKF